jgi:tRNA(Ile2)-agmatinylcytidine synthase
MWLGLDDTDSLDGGCTTLVFHELLEALPCEYGEPRLTRLWPFAARRTRGNAALSVEIFTDEKIVPWLDKYWTDKIEPLKGEIAASMHSDREQYPSDPGMTLFLEQPDEKHYWKAVRGEAGILDFGHQWGGQGRIGAAASCAWPGVNRTWEGIAWRKGVRQVSEESLTMVDEMPETFLCRDPRTKRGLIAPRGPCPIMFGVRATTKQAAFDATKILLEGSAKTIGSRVFCTNQASGDHIESSFTDIVQSKELLKGGHVIINDEFLAFSESGDLNKTAQWLNLGDSFECIGLEFEGKIHLEGLKVLGSISRERPLCECGTRMKSMGKGQGVRCPKCKASSDNVWIESDRIPPVGGWAQPPVDKRRHLAKTLT